MRRSWLPLLALLPALLAGCRGAIVANDENDLVVVNQSTCELRIYVDGFDAFTVPPGRDRMLNDIGPGRHVLEAVKGAEELVQRRTVELGDGEDFYLRIDGC